MGTLRLPSKKLLTKEAKRHAVVKIVRHERVAVAIEWLIRTYPAFAQCLPLALGVHKITSAARPKSISSNILSLAREQWVNSPRYLARIAAPGSQRHNLDGSVAGPVSDEHRAHAESRLGDA